MKAFLRHPTPALLALLVVAMSAVPARAQDATYLHALIVADTGDALIGEDVRVDANNIYNRLALDVPHHRCKITLIHGANATWEKVKAYYHGLAVRSSDALLCYFAGHGGVEGDHYLMMADGQKVKRATLLQTMKQKGARLTMLITDACANPITPLKRGGPRTVVSIPSGRVEACRYLFFRHAGVVDINSSTPPEEAFGDATHGGNFTAAFHQLSGQPNAVIDKNGDGIITWTEFFSLLSQRTEENFQKLKAGSPDLTQATQRVKAWQLAQHVSSTPITYSELRLGIRVFNTTERNGVRIGEVFAGSPAEWYGFQVGEVLTEVTQLNDVGTRGGRAPPVVHRWPTADEAATARAFRDITEPTLLACQLRNPSTGRVRTVYVRTLGFGTE